MASTPEEQMNLRVLSHHLPNLTRILHTSPYAVIYTFQSESSTWEKSGVEGSLFICESTSPHPPTNKYEYALVILNRRGLDNWLVQLTTSEGVQAEGEYIMLAGQKSLVDPTLISSGVEQAVVNSDDGDKVWGIWVFEEDVGSTKGERSRCGELIRSCAQMAEESADVYGNGAEDASGSNLLALLKSNSAPKEQFTNGHQRIASSHPAPSYEQGGNAIDAFLRNGGN